MQPSDDAQQLPAAVKLEDAHDASEAQYAEKVALMEELLRTYPNEQWDDLLDGFARERQGNAANGRALVDVDAVDYDENPSTPAQAALLRSASMGSTGQMLSQQRSSVPQSPSRSKAHSGLPLSRSGSRDSFPSPRALSKSPSRRQLITGAAFEFDRRSDDNSVMQGSQPIQIRPPPPLRVQHSASASGTVKDDASTLLDLQRAASGHNPALLEQSLQRLSRDDVERLTMLLHSEQTLRTLGSSINGSGNGGGFTVSLVADARLSS